VAVDGVGGRPVDGVGQEPAARWSKYACRAMWWSGWRVQRWEACILPLHLPMPKVHITTL